MKGGEDEAVVARLPEELDVGGVGDSRHWDTIGVFGGGAERLWHLLLTYAPVGGHEGHPAQEEGGKRLDEGEARGTHLLQERHYVRTRIRAEAAGDSRVKSPVRKRNEQAKLWNLVIKPLPWKVSRRQVNQAIGHQFKSSMEEEHGHLLPPPNLLFCQIQVGNIIRSGLPNE